MDILLKAFQKVFLWKLFLRPARAFSIAENVAKTWPRITNCHSRISSILVLQRNIHIEMKSKFAAHGKFVLIIWPFKLSTLCRPVWWQYSYWAFWNNCCHSLSVPHYIILMIWTGGPHLKYVVRDLPVDLKVIASTSHEI